jgi:hypothetical protein
VFVSRILFAEVAYFTREEIMNLENVHTCAQETPHITGVTRQQYCDIFAQGRYSEARRQPLLGNGSANMPVAREQLRNTQKLSISQVVFSTPSVPIATYNNNTRIVG